MIYGEQKSENENPTLTIDLTEDDIEMLRNTLYGSEDCENFKGWTFRDSTGRNIDIEFINQEEYEERNKL